jgi:phospholipase C
MNSRLIASFSLILFAVAVSVGCSSGSSSSDQSLLPAGKARHHRSLRPDDNPSPAIQHVVIIIQENRSFNNIFGGPSPFPNASTAAVGYKSNGNPVTLTSVSFANTTPDISHCYQDALAALNPNTARQWQMNGFDTERRGDIVPCFTNCSGTCATSGTFPYKYVNYSETKPYRFMASHWALADHFYPTELGPSFTAHLNLIAGTDEVFPGGAAVDFPSTWGTGTPGCESPKGATVPLLEPPEYDPYGPYPCFYTFHTMADLLDGIYTADTPKVTWRYYAPTPKSGGIWSEFDAIERVRCGTTGPISASTQCPNPGPDWTNDVKTPSSQFITDVKNNSFAGVTWIVPTLPDSDHQGSESTSGPYWVSCLVNTIGNSSYWDHTAIVVLWDDWGGWYDEVAPPQYDFRGKAIRTPMIVISPYTIQGSSSYYGGQGIVSHDEYEPGSILKFIENVWNLRSLSSLPCQYYCSGSLGYTDSTSKYGVAHDTMDFTQTPRPFTSVPTAAPYDCKHFEDEGQYAQAPDSQ